MKSNAPPELGQGLIDPLESAAALGASKNHLAFFPGLLEPRMDAPGTVQAREHFGEPGHPLAHPVLD